jgi:hypothetical protein
VFRKHTNQHQQIDLLRLAQEGLRVCDHILGQVLARPHNAWTKQTVLKGGTLREVFVVEFGEGHRAVFDVELGFPCWVGTVLRDSEGGDDGVGVVVAFVVLAREARALDVEERAVEGLELFRRVASTCGQALIILDSDVCIGVM